MIDKIFNLFNKVNSFLKFYSSKSFKDCSSRSERFKWVFSFLCCPLYFILSFLVLFFLFSLCRSCSVPSASAAGGFYSPAFVASVSRDDDDAIFSFDIRFNNDRGGYWEPVEFWYGQTGSDYAYSLVPFSRIATINNENVAFIPIFGYDFVNETFDYTNVLGLMVFRDYTSYSTYNSTPGVINGGYLSLNYSTDYYSPYTFTYYSYDSAEPGSSLINMVNGATWIQGDFGFADYLVSGYSYERFRLQFNRNTSSSYFYVDLFINTFNRNFADDYEVQYIDINDFYVDVYDNAYETGENAGYSAGYSDGVDVGLDSVSPFTLLKNAVNSLLDIELFPSFHIYHLLLIAVGFMLILILFKLMR